MNSNYWNIYLNGKFICQLKQEPNEVAEDAAAFKQLIVSRYDFDPTIVVNKVFSTD